MTSKMSFGEWFRQTNPSKETTKLQWEAIGGPVTPLKVWQEICDKHDGTETWDTLVECCGFDKDFNEVPHLTPEQSNIVETLGFYGRPVEKEHARQLAGLTPCEVIHFYVVRDGIDGKDMEKFPTLAAAQDHVLKWIGTWEGVWASSETAYHNDYSHFHCVGFTLSDIGIDWFEHRT